MAKEHHYATRTVWTGAEKGATTDYKSYSRDTMIEIEGKPPIPASADPNFLGDPTRHNPEEMLVASLAVCHMLWYLHYCAVKGVVVTGYEDASEGVMVEEKRNGRFTGVTLKPTVTITAESDAKLAAELHEPAHRECFIANSVNFPVGCEPTIVKEEASAA